MALVIFKNTHFQFTELLNYNQLSEFTVIQIPKHSLHCSHKVSCLFAGLTFRTPSHIFKFSLCNLYKFRKMLIFKSKLVFYNFCTVPAATFGITTLSIMTFSIINKSRHSAYQHSALQHSISSAIMLSVLNVECHKLALVSSCGMSLC